MWVLTYFAYFEIINYGMLCVFFCQLQFLVNCVSRVFPNVRFEWLVCEIKRNLPKELDFYYEGENIEQFASKFSHLKFVKVG